jgi:hypothetical protein
MPRVNSFASVTGLFLSAPLFFAQGTSGSISGHVTNSVTGAGIEGVAVQAACMPDSACFPGNPSQPGVTDSAGAFRLAGIPDGRYALLAEKDGLLQKRTSDSEFMLSVSGAARFDLQLTPFARLSGRVVDPEGKPVAGLQVQLEQGEKRHTIILAGEHNKISPKVTEQDGAFVFESVQPGIYTLLAQVKPPAEGKDGERMFTTYYPSVVYPEQALPIQVQGVDLFGYEIRLRTAPARKVRGVVLDPAGKPAPQVSVMLLAKASPGQVVLMRGAEFGFLQIDMPWDSTKTGDDGAFEFPEVLEGDWRIQASGLAAMSRYNTRRAGLADLRVGKDDVDNVSIRLPQLFEIAVSADWSESPAGDQPEIPAPPETFLLPMDGQPFTILHINTPAEMQAGRYLIAPWNSPSGYYVAAAMLDGRDVLGQVAEFRGPATLQMVYKKDGGSVRGTVEKGAGTTVVLMSDAASSPRFAYNGLCDANGSFSIRDVPPGQYTIATFAEAAFQDAQSACFGNPEFLSRVDSRGERVKVDAGATTMVTLRLN